MNKSRIEETSKYIDICLKYGDYSDALLLLYKNNDYLSDPNRERYSSVMDICSLIIYEEYVHSTNHELEKIYDDITHESRLFISSNYGKNVISLYAAIYCMMRNGVFWGKEVINTDKDYKDYFNLLGLDVILGKSCCRHKAAVYRDIMKGFTDAKIICVGPNENDDPDHVIFCVNDKRRRLFLDSIIPHLYYPCSNDKLIGPQAKKYYIKAVGSYVNEHEFDNTNEFYKYFNSVYRKSALSIDKWELISLEILKKCLLYDEDKGLMDQLSLKLKPYREKIKKEINK